MVLTEAGEATGGEATSGTSVTKCCLCYGKVVTWSLSGTCSQCRSGIDKLAAAPAQCRTASSSPTVTKTCLNLCEKALIGGSGGGGRTCSTATGGTCKLL